MTRVLDRAARAAMAITLQETVFGDGLPPATMNLSRSGADKVVRAVILALREPSEAMLAAGGEKHSGNDYFDTKKDFEDEASAIYRAMIDAALAEGG